MSSVAAIPFPPILREGDRLDAKEFLRRWEAMPELKNAELIGGVVFMASPVGRPHGQIHFQLAGWLSAYAEATPGCDGATEATWVMGSNAVPQPDLSLRIHPHFGGQSHNADNYFGGAPELIVEVSASSMSRDLGIKLDLYRKAGVCEYLTILLQPQQVIWRRLSRGTYKELAPDSDGFLKSRVFPGLWLDPEAVWNPECRLRKAADAGLKSPEHTAFVQQLKSASERPRRKR